MAMMSYLLAANNLILYTVVRGDDIIPHCSDFSNTVVLVTSFGDDGLSNMPILETTEHELCGRC